MGECLRRGRCPRGAALPQAQAGSRPGEQGAAAPGAPFLGTRIGPRQPGSGRKWWPRDPDPHEILCAAASGCYFGGSEREGASTPGAVHFSRVSILDLKNKNTFVIKRRGK